ncbi:carbon-nitrogen hydrolase family protein [Winslowiella iniecta]|uniref:Amidohydrolase n=1 Tax=Winslowiella iniecta TaxID=1560201 RepID=A0A0L7TB79_9GAMM|nr:carbon-nitrogen hydrolase family protein [Winslowiella iniecta]KOC88987.1 amidohydrolase [Winslowiella iniecta]KOC92634.1 amidohydrolase [Winslowiella iniecta]
MSLWSVAAAQYASRSRDIDGNISHHLSFIQQAASQNVDLLLFPQLSLTGYEIDAGRELALSLDDTRLDVLAEAAQHHQMNIIVGMPLRAGDSYHIAAVSFLSEGTRLAYAKRNLRGREVEFFQPGYGGPVFGSHSRNVAMAVCADIAVEQFAREASENGADLYATGVLISEPDYASHCNYLASWAVNYQMTVLMANHAQPTGGYQSVGGSAFWDASGKQIIRCKNGEQLLIARRDKQGWQGEIHPLG